MHTLGGATWRSEQGRWDVPPSRSSPGPGVRRDYVDLAPEQRVTVAWGTGTQGQDAAIIEHVEDGVAVLAPLGAWVSATLIPDQAIDSVTVTFPWEDAAGEVEARVRRWPGRPRAHMVLHEFGTPKRVSRRRWARVSIDESVRVHLTRRSQHETLDGRTVDLSAGGIRIALDVALPLGTEVALSVDLFEGGFLTVAKVLDCEKPWGVVKHHYVRLQFSQLSGGDVNRIAALVLKTQIEQRKRVA